MQLAIISDIHANYEALSAVSDILEKAELVLCLGDFVGYYCQVNEVIDYIRSLNAICVSGNHDNFLLHGCPSSVLPAVRFGIEFAARTISADNREWLSHLPLLWGGFLGERLVLSVHGSPWRPLEDYLYLNNPMFKQLDIFDYDIIAFGQTHRCIQRIGQKPYLLNPGSIGQPRDHKGVSSLLVLETESMKVEKIERAFDVNRVIDLAIQNGAGEWIGRHLL
jgi:putative phosphoesterase